MSRLLLLIAFLLLPVTGFAEIKIIELQHRPATDLVEQVRELLDAGEKAQAAGSHLVIIADGDTLAAAEQLTRLLDRPLVTLLVRVLRTENRHQLAKRNSAAVRFGNRTQLSGAGGSRLGNSSVNIEQRLQIIEGGRGLIEIGREIPYTREWSVLAGEISGYSEKIAYKTIATGFWVHPLHIRNNTVLVDIEPYIGSDKLGDSKNAPVVNFSQLKTRVQLALGEWVPLSSQLNVHDQLSQAIVTWRSDNGQAEQELMLRIDPLEGFSP